MTACTVTVLDFLKKLAYNLFTTKDLKGHAIDDWIMK